MGGGRGGGGKDGVASMSNGATSMSLGSGVVAHADANASPPKLAYVQEECLPWMFEKIRLARKNRSGETTFTEPQKIQIQDFLSSPGGSKLFAYETEDGQLRVDSHLSTNTREVIYFIR